MTSILVRCVARNLQRGEGCFEGMGAEPLAARGHWDPGEECLDVEKFCIFSQNGLNIRPILIKINALKRGIKISSPKS